MNNDDEGRRLEENDPINLLMERFGFFGCSMPSSVQMVTDLGTLDVDATSGKNMESTLAKVRVEHLCRHWKSKINEKCQKGEVEGTTEIQIK